MDLPIDTPAAAPPALAVRPPKRPGIWSGLGIVGLYFALQFGFAMLFGAGVGLYVAVRAGIGASVHHAHAAPPAIQTAIHAMLARPDVAVAAAIVTIVGAVVVLGLLVRQSWPALWRVPDPPGFGFHRAHAYSDYPVAVLLGLGVVLVGGALRQFLAHGHPIPQNVGVLFSHAGPAARVLLAAIAIVVAPLGEELAFRGALLAGFMRRMPATWAVLATAVIFGCAHLPDFKFAWYAIPSLVIVGIALGWMRLHARSLWPAVVLHATNNAVAVLAWFLMLYRR